MSEKIRYHRLIAEYQTGQLPDEAFAELESALRDSSDARKLFHRACRIDSSLRREAENVSADIKSGPHGKGTKIASISPGKEFRNQPFFRPLAAAAVIVLLSALTWTIAAQRRVVATLISSEDAVWERSTLTEPGTSLTKGALKLSSGIATIQFISGVELTLEAPVRLYVKGPMRASLQSGTVVVKSESSDDFVLESEFGQSVSQQGAYAAFSVPSDSRTDFEAISGKVTISHDVSREVTQLVSGATASLLSDRLNSSEAREAVLPFEPFEQGVRIRTDGRAATFIRNNRIHKWTRPEFLSLKTSTNGNSFDQRAVIAFDLTQVDSGEIESVHFRLNLVHSGHGLISRLPKGNRFSVYGLVSSAKEDWSADDLWEEAPAPEDGVLVATFEIPRSQTSGEIDLNDEALLDFVRERAGRSASFVLTRTTANLDGEGPGYTHAIANDAHPEASGPVLEILLKK